MRRAVLVIDVQQGLCEGAAFDCAKTIKRINIVTRKARAGGLSRAGGVSRLKIVQGDMEKEETP